MLIILFCYVCIFVKLRQKLKQKKERLQFKNIEMVALDESKEINSQARNVNESSWNTIKQWVKQKSFIYQVHSKSDFILILLKISWKDIWKGFHVVNFGSIIICRTRIPLQTHIQEKQVTHFYIMVVRMGHSRDQDHPLCHHQGQFTMLVLLNLEP